MTEYNVPSADENSCRFTIPIDGRGPVTVRAPKFAWMNPKHVAAYNEWLEQLFKRAREWDAWAETQIKVDENGEPILDEAGNKIPLDEADRSEPPHPESEVRADGRRMQLQWLKPYMKAQDFRALVENASTAQAQWIYDRMNGEPLPATEDEVAETADIDRIDSGESKASQP